MPSSVRLPRTHTAIIAAVLQSPAVQVGRSDLAIFRFLDLQKKSRVADYFAAALAVAEVQGAAAWDDDGSGVPGATTGERVTAQTEVDRSAPVAICNPDLFVNGDVFGEVIAARSQNVISPP